MKCDGTNINNIILLIDDKLNCLKESLIDEKVGHEEKRAIIDVFGRIMKDLDIPLKNGTELFKAGINKEETDKLLIDLAKQYKLRKSKIRENDGELSWVLHDGEKYLYVDIVKENYYVIGSDSWNGSAFSYEELKNYIELWVQGIFDAEHEAVKKYQNKKEKVNEQ